MATRPPSRPAAPTARQLGPGPHTTVKRHADRARYDATAVHAVIDEALCCHVAFVDGAGQARVLPTAHARLGDAVYLHGAVGNHMLAAIDGQRVALCFTLIDGLVFAPTAMHHSMNYRSAIVFGVARNVSDENEKNIALDAFIDQVAPGRGAELGPMPHADRRATRVLRVPIEEAAHKRRSGPCGSEADVVADAPQWSGVMPLSLRAGNPLPDPHMAPGRAPSPAVARRAAAMGAETPLERREQGLLFSSDRTRLDVGLIRSFLRDDSYWASGAESDRAVAAIESSVCFGVYDGGRQLAYARAVTDGQRLAYLADVFVVPDARGKGLGARLLRFVLSHPAVRDATRILLGTRDAHGFYAKLGFAPAEDRLYLVRPRESAAAG